MCAHLDLLLICAVIAALVPSGMSGMDNYLAMNITTNLSSTHDLLESSNSSSFTIDSSDTSNWTDINNYRMQYCGQYFESESITLSAGVFRYPPRGQVSYENCLRKSWIISHERRFSGQGYRVTLRRLALETCCDRLSIAGVGPGGLLDTYPSPFTVNSSMFFRQSTLNVTLSTDMSVTNAGFELELEPYTGPQNTSGSCATGAPPVVVNVSAVGTSARLKYPESGQYAACERRTWLFALDSSHANLRSMVYIKWTSLESERDFLYVVPFGKPAANTNRFTGDHVAQRTLATGDGTAQISLLQVDSNVVNITFVSDAFFHKNGFEIIVFPDLLPL